MIQHGDDFAIGIFPQRHACFNRFANVAGEDVMPAPIIETGNMPTVFESVVERKDLAQKIPRAPEIVFVRTRAH